MKILESNLLYISFLLSVGISTSLMAERFPVGDDFNGEPQYIEMQSTQNDLVPLEKSTAKSIAEGTKWFFQGSDDKRVKVGDKEIKLTGAALTSADKVSAGFSLRKKSADIGSCIKNNPKKVGLALAAVAGCYLMYRLYQSYQLGKVQVAEGIETETETV